MWKLFSGEQLLFAASPSSDLVLSQLLQSGMLSLAAQPKLCPEAVWQLVQRSSINV